MCEFFLTLLHNFLFVGIGKPLAVIYTEYAYIYSKGIIRLLRHHMFCCNTTSNSNLLVAGKC